MQQYLIPRRIALSCAALFLCLIIVNATGMVRIETVTEAVPAFCPFKAITGIACPGCGMTRAMTSLIDGRPGDAILYNPFCFFLLFILLLSIMPGRWSTLSRLYAQLLPVFYGLVLFLVLAFWVVDRLLPSIVG
ncbi:MAG: hypothetical protein H6Q52_1143 [Deltaproteobacteria bacterium]|nr:hypothetical protein [Deltaproteobacteria bacterium]